MTPSFAWFLVKHDVDRFLSHYLPGFPQKALVLFGKETWSLEDLLDLPSSEIEGRTGIYLIVAFQPVGAFIGYIGSAGGCKGIAHRNKRRKSTVESSSK